MSCAYYIRGSLGIIIDTSLGAFTYLISVFGTQYEDVKCYTSVVSIYTVYKVGHNFGTRRLRYCISPYDTLVFELKSND